MRKDLVRGGILIFETYLESPERVSGWTLCRDYLLKENELLDAFRSLRNVFYHERKERKRGEPLHSPSLVALIAVVKKNVPLFQRFFLQPLIPQCIVSELYYEKRYKPL